MAQKKLLKKVSSKSEKTSVEKDPHIELLKSIVEGLINKQAVPILDLLSSKKPANEFTIAEKLGLTINPTRNILYKLSDFGLVSFTRKKDKRKGWYIYFWYLNTHQSLILLEENLRKKLDGLRAHLQNRKNSRYYICRTCSIEVNEETALLHNFTCPECTSVYERAFLRYTNQLNHVVVSYVQHNDIKQLQDSRHKIVVLHRHKYQ